LALRYNRRQITEVDGAIAFKTPEAWIHVSGIRPRYDDVHFERRQSSRRKGTVLGVGNRLFEVALNQAAQLTETNAVTGKDLGSETLFLFRCFDRVTGNIAQPKAVICGVAYQRGTFDILKDWQVLLITNTLASSVRQISDSDADSCGVPAGNGELLNHAESLLRDRIAVLDTPFRQPDLELLAIICAGEN
jgi:hypothetical protein